MDRRLRFAIGDRVRILPTDPGPFAGLQGMIAAIEPHARGIAVLDRYTVAFEWGEKQVFYDPQLIELHSGSRSTGDLSQ